MGTRAKPKKASRKGKGAKTKTALKTAPVVKPNISEDAPVARRGAGRPPKLVEDEKLIAQISALAKMQCTQAEAAAVLNVDEDTFRAYLGKNPESMMAWVNGPAAGRASLRRQQYIKAQKGSDRMLIWLGKQYLAQAEKIESTGKGGGPVEIRKTFDLAGLSDDELEAYRLLAARASRDPDRDRPASVP